MKMLKIASLVLGMAALLTSPTFAADKYASKEEAQTMTEKAAELVKQDPTAAFAKFQDKAGGFIDRDLYVFVVGKDGTFKAHGAKPALVGKNGMEIKDANGLDIIKEFIAAKDASWVDYKWPDQTDGGKVKDKSSYIRHVGDYVLGVGYFKQ